MPAIRGKAGENVVAACLTGWTVDCDVVVVEADDQSTKSEMAGEGGGFVRYSLHQVTIGCQDESVVVHDRCVAGDIGPARRHALSQS